jgi:hypothetical protein
LSTTISIFFIYNIYRTYLDFLTYFLFEMRYGIFRLQIRQTLDQCQSCLSYPLYLGFQEYRSWRGRRGGAAAVFLPLRGCRRRLTVFCIF